MCNFQTICDAVLPYVTSAANTVMPIVGNAAALVSVSVPGTQKRMEFWESILCEKTNWVNVSSCLGKTMLVDAAFCSMTAVTCFYLTCKIGKVFARNVFPN